MTASLRLLINRDAVAQNLEASPPRRDQIDRRNRKSLANLGRQTGGPGLVVSERAVFDRDLHRGVFITVIVKPVRTAE
jgi:hypothetical protein